MSKVLELYGIPTRSGTADWHEIASKQHCPFLKRKCLKVRKSEPNQTIGTCTVLYGKRHPRPIVICPHRLLGRYQVFTDCMHLLALHEPGNELHIVSEVTIPGGSVDYFLVSARSNRVRDFVGIEFQTLDTTGTVWPERQRFLEDRGAASETETVKGFGMNWKMTAKTILVQLHHKVRTFEGLGKHLALVIQDHFMGYMRSQFRFDHLNDALLGDSLHIHTYQLMEADSFEYHLQLQSRYSMDSDGIAEAMGMQADPNLELEGVIALLESRIGDNTLFVPFN